MSHDPKTGEVLEPRPFADVIRELAGGATYSEVTDLLGEAVAAVLFYRKGAEITLKLKIMPAGENSVRIIDDVKAKIPQPARTETVFFSEKGALMRDNPRQLKMPLRTIEAVAEREPPREIPAEPERQLRTV